MIAIISRSIAVHLSAPNIYLVINLHYNLQINYDGLTLYAIIMIIFKG